MSGNLMNGYSLESLFVLNNCKRGRVSSFDRTGGNHDWMDLDAGESKDFAVIGGSGVIRHIWCTLWAYTPESSVTPDHLRKIVIRMFWDGETSPSVEVPIGDFFGVGHARYKSFQSAPLSMSPEDGRAFQCYFPMPFSDGARLVIENQSEGHVNFYYYVDYDAMAQLPPDCGRFHAQWRRESNTAGWAPIEPGLLEREKAPGHELSWYPAVWMQTNETGKDNYVILEAEGRGKYVGCNLAIDVFERQANDWYGEGDDMIFIDGAASPTLHGTGTEDYFGTAFCPKTEFSSPFSGLTMYSGEEAGFPWGGKNAMYRFHIHDPIHFEKSIKVTIEHGHANKLSNDYASTAYWYQEEPHRPFPPLPDVPERLPRKDKESDV